MLILNRVPGRRNRTGPCYAAFQQSLGVDATATRLRMIDPDEEQPEVSPEHRAAWENYVAVVDQAMKEYTKPFVTPISRVLKDADGEYGELHGTGNYVQFSGRKYLVTNEHVAEAMERSSLGHQFFNCEDVFRTTNPFLAIPKPLDVAVTAIDNAVWVHSAHNAAAIPEDKWELVHATLKGEILFLKGYAGEHSHFHFNYLISNATSFASQEVQLPTDDDRLDPKFHFAISYRPDRAVRLGENN